jgi:hypothetical protein
MENDHTFSSFASAGSRKRRRRKSRSRRSMMTNLRTTKRKMFLLQPQCLLPGILNLFVHKINSLMWSFRVQLEEVEMKTLASQSQPQAGPSRLAVAAEHLGVQSS